jgi:hypothetical protein
MDEGHAVSPKRSLSRSLRRGRQRSRIAKLVRKWSLSGFSRFSYANKTGSFLTRCWRKMDSNFWSLDQSSSAVSTSDARRNISVMFGFDAHLA